MTGEVPDREMGGDGNGSSRSAAPFDLGDSRDLAAAVRAAWGEQDTTAESAPADQRVEVPRPSIARRGTRTFQEVVDDPLAALRSGAKKRRRLRLPGSLHLPTTRPQTRTLVAAGGTLAALLAAAAVPIVSGATQPTPELAERRTVRPTTTTARPAAPTTAFTYPPETILPPEPTTASSSPPSARIPSGGATAEPPTRVTAAPTATTARPRPTSTTRSAPKPTQAPTTTTTQAPPPPDDGGGSGDPTEPPPYP